MGALNEVKKIKFVGILNEKDIDIWGSLNEKICKFGDVYIFLKVQIWESEKHLQN